MQSIGLSFGYNNLHPVFLNMSTKRTPDIGLILSNFLVRRYEMDNKKYSYKRDAHLFVFDTMSDWEASYAIAGINNPQFQKNPGIYRMRTVALRKTSVVSIGGIRIQPDLTLDELSTTSSAMFIIPGGTAWDEGKNIEAVDIARALLSADIPVAAICGATAGLARGGLLDIRRHTSNSREYLAATHYLGEKLYEDEPAITDNYLITASAMAPVDFAYHIFKCLDIYSTPVLEAWYGLFKTGRTEYFGALMKAIK
jgi:putative intracellular protease/amidase